MTVCKKAVGKVILIDLICFFILGIYILLEDRALRLPIPCMEKWRLLAEHHPFKVTQKVEISTQIPTAFRHL